MRTRHQLLAIAILLGCTTIAAAADQTILGKSITVKDKPGDPTKRKVTTSGKEKNSANTIVGNPTNLGLSGGGVLQIFAFGATSSSQTFTLPQGTSGFTGKQFWNASGANGFKYKDALGEQGPVKSVLIKRSPSGSFSIKAKVSAKNGTVNVVPPNPGTSACTALQIGVGPGFGDRYSIQYGPESNIKNSPKIFKAKKPTLEGVCPGGPIIPTTTTTSTTTSSTSTTLYGSPSRAFFETIVGLLD